MNPLNRFLVGTAIFLIVLTVAFWNLTVGADPTGPEQDQTFRVTHLPVTYHFQAILVNKPDRYKQFQWNAIPVSETWNDTILIDFDFGPDVENQTTGDTIWVVADYDQYKEPPSWIYWHREHWKQIVFPQ